jgi:hypothetical protein
MCGGAALSGIRRSIATSTWCSLTSLALHFAVLSSFFAQPFLPASLLVSPCIDMLSTSFPPPSGIGVVGHEYFHNYTGNRVTCRDWFQLTLKEGLTVYRDQVRGGTVALQGGVTMWCLLSRQQGSIAATAHPPYPPDFRPFL